MVHKYNDPSLCLSRTDKKLVARGERTEE